MANNEASFADRLGRARTLSGAIGQYSPAFAPPDVSLVPAAFATFVDSIEAANDTLGEKREEFSNVVAERQALLALVEARAQRAMSYVKSNAAWQKRYETAKMTYDKLRGYRPAKVKAPTGDSAEEKKAAKVGQQSFADIEGLFSKLIKALEKVPGYAPPANELTIAEVQALDAEFTAKNEQIAELSPEIGLLVRERSGLYEELAAKAKAIKAAVSAQYGLRSAEYVTIKGLRF